jgi:lipopolysaccharide export system protein LptC
MPDVAPAISARQKWAAPGGSHDRTIGLARILMPAAIGVLGAALIFAPLAMRGDISFVLAKDKVDMAKERMRVSAATYRGEDSKGQPFVLQAGSAVQVSSRDPVVRITDLSAKIALSDGPATLTANSGRYDMDREIVHVDGPLLFNTADGYRLATRDVAVGLRTRRLASGGPVDGQMPLGSFSAERITADLSGRSVTLEGRARLHIVQRSAR